jgi:hypothetical protein
MHPARSGDRNVVGGDRAIPDRGIGLLRRGDRYTTDRWNPSGTVGGGGTFDPTTIAGLKLWLKADSLALADGAAVATWPDQSGNGNNFAQGTGANQPIFKTAIVNSKPVVRFDGINDLLVCTASLIGTSSSFYTVIAVCNLASISAGPHNYFSSGVAGLNYSVQLRRDTSNLSYYHNDGGSGVPAQETGGVATGVWNVISADWNGSNIHLWRNGTLKATVGSTTQLGFGTNNAVGAFDPAISGQYWDGDIAEVLIYNSALSATDRVNVENYLGAKYGITITPTLLAIKEIREGLAREKPAP